MGDVMGKRVGLLAGLLVLALGSGVVAQEPSPEPPPWFGGRVEMPEHGFAVTGPDHWVAFDATGDVDEQVRTAVTMLDLELFEASAQSIAESLRSAGQSGSQLVFMDPTRDTSCQFAVWPADQMGDLDQVAAMMHAAVSTDDTVTDLQLPAEVALAAGAGRLITWRSIGEVEDATYIATYMGKGVMAFMVVCVGEERAEDDWLSIAETFEFLPAEE